MKAIRDALDKAAPHFEKGGKLEKLYALYEAQRKWSLIKTFK